VKLKTLISKKDLCEISILIAILIVTLIIIWYTKTSQYQFEILYPLLLITMSIEGYIISSSLINRIERKTKHIRRIRTSPKIRRKAIGRPFEYLFFILLFVATILLSYALVEEDNFIRIIYYALGILCYSTAIFCGWGHYKKKLYD